jgi:hypothetical protein
MLKQKLNLSRKDPILEEIVDPIPCVGADDVHVRSQGQVCTDAVRIVIEAACLLQLRKPDLVHLSPINPGCGILQHVHDLAVIAVAPGAKASAIMTCDLNVIPAAVCQIAVL